MMLQRSLSTASLLKQAAAAVQAQETRSSLRPGLARSNTDYTAFAFSARRSSQGTSSSIDPSVDSSSLASPSVERKHIHFNEQVEQCIAVEVKGDDDDDVEHDWYGRDSDSEDGFMMKRTRTKRRKPIKRRGTKKSPKADGKIIAMLPSTTLKYREDTPGPQETAMKHSTGNLRNAILSPSPSDETLRQVPRMEGNAIRVWNSGGSLQSAYPPRHRRRMGWIPWMVGEFRRKGTVRE